MIYAKKALRERRIPFEVEAYKDPFYSKSNMEAIDRSIQCLKEGRVVVKTMEELADKADVNVIRVWEKEMK